jgi:molecular chaperone HscB
LPPDFLMEVMELNEMKMDGAEEEDLKKRVAALQSEISNDIKPIITNYQEGVTSQDELLKVKDYYYKLKYLDRIKESR